MTNEEVQNIKQRLDNVIDATNDLGNSALQLKNARKDLKTVSDFLNETNNELASLASKCNEYMTTLGKIVSSDIDENLKASINQAETSIANLKDLCDNVANNYKNVIEIVGEKITENSDATIDNINRNTENLMAKYKKDIQDIHYSVDQHGKVINNLKKLELLSLITNILIIGILVYQFFI